MCTRQKPHDQRQASDPSSRQSAAGMPKAELHVHLEGLITPETQVRIANRNGIALKETTADQIRESMDFTELRGFLASYNRVLELFQTEQDYFEVAFEYLQTCAEQNIRHTEIHFDPQLHMGRGIEPEVFMPGIRRAREKAEQELDVTSQLIFGIYWDQGGITGQEAMEILRPSFDQIVAIGLYPDDVEKYTPVEKFEGIVRAARAAGLYVTAHCNSEQPHSVEAITKCIRLLKVDRIDHGTDVIRDDALCDEVVRKNICFTTCPTAYNNTPPRRLKEIREMLERGVNVTVNSDDPAFMSDRYQGDIYGLLNRDHGFSLTDLQNFSGNAIRSSWIDDARTQKLLRDLENYTQKVAG